MKKSLRIALAGNPNAGKSTIFNALTGDDQHVGNWPGKTVEVKTGYFQIDDLKVEITDLPGTYSLSSFSPEEEIARNFLIQEKPDLVINVVDASNLERNLYLTLQVLETHVPTLILLNMNDVAERRGLTLNTKLLSEKLGGVEIIQMTANKNFSGDELKRKIIATAGTQNDLHLEYPKPITEIIDQLVPVIRQEAGLKIYDPTHLAVQLLEGDRHLIDDISLEAKNTFSKILGKSQENFEEDISIAIADHRYKIIQGITEKVISRKKGDVSFSDRVDNFVTNKFFGIPIFFVTMYIVFQLVQNVSAPYLDWIDGVFTGPLTHWATTFLIWVNAPDWVSSLIVDGVLAGVGGILVFLPGLFMMYLLLAILEQSGYMARAAFVMDRFMNKARLHGKSFIPMILGFGCNVPAIYATRTIKKPEARILTSLLIPFMSCSARLPVYLIFGMAFFPDKSNIVIFSLYLLGILVAASIGIILSRTLFRGETLSIMVMELPPYRLPTLSSILKYAKNQSSKFVKNAGTIIVVFSTILWLLLNLPWGVQNARDSYFGQVSNSIAPILAPAGFGTWEASGSLVTGLVAKEIVVSTFAQIYHIPQEEIAESDLGLGLEFKEIAVGFGEATILAGKETLEVFTPGITLFPDEELREDIGLSKALRSSFTPLSAYAFLVFVLLYVPCAATMGAQKQEFGWKWMTVSIAITLIVPWILSVLVFQGGTLLGLG
ncbi:MAG: ferrous iron transport protein B [Chloroflexi bacterium]|jgi:ferrous iron transport protein B|nr:ferrous iron transport protein B [Chloroflexota bacterium]MBT3670753.1 ferrous iron transport protein B [Chloroflexota bacterium]MBT4004126.1 ferrous iron transport protein B [Chloroflexota bacterium]MBT4305121.1 ferrous iron transport protein B [Chloroflexota bacterium]MBT4533357.1 ferrous iron transport protein B [Chloroflexota bacterium]